MRFFIRIACVLIIGMFLGNCMPSKTYERKGIEKSCEPYYLYIKKSYQKNNEGVFDFSEAPEYDTTMSKLSGYVNNDCLTGLNKRQVEKLFGEPSEKSDNHFFYYHKKECFKAEERKPGCAKLIFFFDDDGKVKEVRLPMVEKPVKY